MSPSDFLKDIESLLRKIAVAQGIRVNRRNLYYPLRGLEITDRKRRWFPTQAVIQRDTYPMEQKDYVDVRERLALARDPRGLPCLGDEDLHRLDLAWVAYQECWAQPGIRVSKETPKLFEVLLRASRIEGRAFDDVQVLAEFVEEHIGKTGNNHDFSGSAKNRRAIFSAFQNGHFVFGSSETVKRVQLEVILEACSFYSRVSNHAGEMDGYIRLMKKSLNSMKSPFLVQGLLAVEHLQEPLSLAAARALDHWEEEGRTQLYDKLFHPYMIYRSVDMAIDIALEKDLDAPSAILGGRNIERLLSQAKEIAVLGGDKKALYLLELVRAKMAAYRGKLGEALSGVDAIRANARRDGFLFADLDRSLSLATALAFYRASGGKDVGYLWSARQAIVSAGQVLPTFEESLRAPHKRLVERIFRSP